MALKVETYARKSYLFGKNYTDLFDTIKSSFVMTADTTKDNLHNIADPDYDGVIGRFGLRIFYVFLLISRIIFGFLFTAIFSVLHIIIVTIMMIGVYFAFVVIAFIDRVYRTLKRISNNCPNPKCQKKYSLPVYHCPNCQAPHRYLYPSRYGIFKHECTCGTKLPTLLINGRHKLDGTCPHCGYAAFKGLNHSTIFPVFGGRSSGKTCFINSALTEIENTYADQLNCQYDYVYNFKGDERKRFKQYMDAGNLPESTHDDGLVYYNFQFSPKGDKNIVKNFISLCDISGEVFQKRENVAKQVGYHYADSTIFVLDPLAINDFRDEMSNAGYDVASYAYSRHEISDILGTMVTTLEEMHRNKNAKVKLIVALTKGDIPLLEEQVGDEKVKAYMKSHKGCDKWRATDALVEQFLVKYGESNAVNMLKNQFAEVHYFVTSATGKDHKKGEPFHPYGTALPVLWAIDKAYKNLNFDEALWRKK